MSPFQLASFEFLDMSPLSAWIVINMVEELWFLSGDIPVKFLSADSKPIEGLYIEFNFDKRKWLLSCSDNSNKNSIMNLLDALRRNFDLYSSEYEHVTLLGDFNVEAKEPWM